MVTCWLVDSLTCWLKKGPWPLAISSPSGWSLVDLLTRWLVDSKKNSLTCWLVDSKKPLTPKLLNYDWFQDTPIHQERTGPFVLPRQQSWDCSQASHELGKAMLNACWWTQVKALRCYKQIIHASPGRCNCGLSGRTVISVLCLTQTPKMFSFVFPVFFCFPSIDCAQHTK